jgi:hypothetical protein
LMKVFTILSMGYYAEDLQQEKGCWTDGFCMMRLYITNKSATSLIDCR